MRPNGPKITPSDFRLTFTDAEFKWAGETRAGLPLLRWPDGTICEPVLTYFGYSAEMGRVRASSMRPEAYAIRDWLAFLWNEGKAWDEADDLLLRRWRESQRPAVDAAEIEARQVERKLGCVFEFYRLIPSALGLGDDLRPFPLLVGQIEPKTGHTYPIQSKTAPAGDGRSREVWAGAEPTSKKQTKRPTPDDHQVQRILSHLRAEPSRKDGSTPAGPAVEPERNWLIGRSMVDGGLRAEEASNLALHALAKALQAESIQGLTEASGAPHPLDRLSSDPEGQETVLGALSGLESRSRTNLYVEVTGKGAKTRQAPFAIDLVRDLLVAGVWGVRRTQIAEWSRLDRDFVPTGHLFLSSKTRSKLLPGTVSDLMKEAFTAAGVDGSGHRLRAYYATKTAVRIWDECFALNGYRFDQTVLNMALDRLAEAMGHSSVTTTVRHYLDMALLKDLGAAGQKTTKDIKSLWEEIAKNRANLGSSKLTVISKIVAKLAISPNGSELEQVLTLAADDRDLDPAR